jgi:hypothetical protein
MSIFVATCIFPLSILLWAYFLPVFCAYKICAVHGLTGFRLWRQYWRKFWGYIFWGSIFTSKMGPFAPFSATIQALSRTRAFLLSENERELLCMGRTFTVACTEVNNCTKHVVCQLGIESGSCKS